jgi:hypothetical protein
VSKAQRILRNCLWGAACGGALLVGVAAFSLLQ